MFADGEREQHVGDLLRAGRTLGDGGEIGLHRGGGVASLQKEPAGQQFQHPARRRRVGQAAGLQNPQVFLRRQNLARAGIDFRRDDHLQKQIRHGGGGFRIEGAVDGDDAAEGADRIAAQRACVGVLQRGRGGDAARVGVLYDGDRRLGKLGHQFESGVGVVQIVVAQFFALKLRGGGDAGARIPGGVERRRLVRVLAVAQRLHPCAGNGGAARERIIGLRREPGADGGIVGGGAGIGIRCQPSAQRRRGGAVIGRHLFHHRGVILNVGDYRDAFVILRRGADQGRSTDIDVLDTGIEIAAAGDGLLERV